VLGLAVAALALGGCGYDLVWFGPPDASAAADSLPSDASASDAEPPGDAPAPGANP
jgi:hypothetical protein